MKIYRSVVLDCSTWNIIAEDSFEYDGPLTLCTGAEEAAAASGAAKAAAPAATGLEAAAAGAGSAGGAALGAGTAGALAPGVAPAAAGLGAGGLAGTEAALAGLGAGAAGGVASEAIPRVEITGQAPPAEGVIPPVVPPGAVPGTQPMASTAPGAAPAAAPATNALNRVEPGMRTPSTTSGLPPGGLDEEAASLGAGPEVSGTQEIAKKSGVEKALESLGIWKNGELGRNALPLGLNLGSAALQRNSASSLQKQLQKTAAPAAATSERLLQESASGQIPPAVMQQFDKSLKDKVSEIQQRYANMGRDASTDSAAQAEIQKATDARDAQVAQYSSQLTTQGLQAAQVASGPSTQAALAGAQQDQALSQAMAQSLQQMALLEALSRRGSGV